MNDIGPGDWVECIYCRANSRFSIGSIYKVELVVKTARCTHCNKCNAGLKIFGISIRINELGKKYFPGVCCFRPIYRPKADLTAKLLQPIEDGVFNKLDRRIRSGAKR